LAKKSIFKSPAKQLYDNYVIQTISKLSSKVVIILLYICDCIMTKNSRDHLNQIVQ